VQLQGLSNDDFAAAKVSPVKVDSRAEECPCCGGVGALDHQGGAASMELQGKKELRLLDEKIVESNDSAIEPYQLHVQCKRLGKHTPGFFCCKILEEDFPIPPPPSVHHPTLGLGHLSTVKGHCDATSSTYGFSVQGKMHYEECFTNY
jgi:hypothetical protein